MTDTPTPSTESEDDDLLASLYLDGEATAEERAEVEASPELMARVRSVTSSPSCTVNPMASSARNP